MASLDLHDQSMLSIATATASGCSGTVTCDDAGLDAAVAEFARVRPRLVRVASRILGSWVDAEDIVQDAWLRWQSCDRSLVVNPTAFLVTTTTRLALTAATSARARHETYVGRWLTDPLDASEAPAERLERREALEAGFALLGRLSAVERAAYVLRHAFGYPYAQLGEILHVTEANARQLVSRAGKRLDAERRSGDATRRTRPSRTRPPQGARPRLAPPARSGHPAHHGLRRDPTASNHPTGSEVSR